MVGDATQRLWWRKWGEWFGQGTGYAGGGGWAAIGDASQENSSPSMENNKGIEMGMHRYDREKNKVVLEPAGYTSQIFV